MHGSLGEVLYLLWHTPEVVGGDVQLLKCLQVAEGQGELVQTIIGQREGHEVTEEVEIGDPTNGPWLT